MLDTTSASPSAAPARLSSDEARPALTRTISSTSRRSSRSASPQTSPVALLHAPLPPAPIPTRLRSSKLILDRTSPFHKRSVSMPQSEAEKQKRAMGLGLVIKVEGEVILDGPAESEREKREWAERVLWGVAGKKIKGNKG